MEKTFYKATVTVERDGKQWDVTISLYNETKQRAQMLIDDFKKRCTSVKVIGEAITKLEE